MTSPHFPDRLTAGVRRVTTGVDPQGKAVVVTDERVTGDARALPIWSADAPPIMGDPAMPAAHGWWPPAGGVRVTLSSRKPGAAPAAVTSGPNAWPDINDAAGFHASCSADIVLVISGRIWLELDDDVELVLEAGDTLIQNGTRHRWHNHGQDWPIMAVIIIGAQHGASA